MNENMLIEKESAWIKSFEHILLKVSKSQKQIMASWILPKNERWGIFQYIKLPQRSFFGRIQDAIICFWDLLTFKYLVFFKFSVQNSADESENSS